MSEAATAQVAEERVRELVGQYHDAYERRDKRAVADLFAEDAVISIAPGTFRGREGIRRVLDWDWKATPTIGFRPMGIDVLVRGNVAVCEVMVEASYAGVRYEYPNVRVFEFGDDGKIHALRSYYDKLGIEQHIAHELTGVKGRLFRVMLDRLVSEGEKGLRGPGGARREALAKWRYVSAGIVGVTVGGLIVALAARAVPKMASRMASGMMQGMAQRMREGGCDPGRL